MSYDITFYPLPYTFSDLQWGPPILFCDNPNVTLSGQYKGQGSIIIDVYYTSDIEGTTLNFMVNLSALAGIYWANPISKFAVTINAANNVGAFYQTE